METWFWIVGWFLSILTITGNGFIIFLVTSKRNLRTKTNAFVVSLALADLCVGITVVPTLFVCNKVAGCNSEDNMMYIVRNFFAFASVMNLCSLVLDRFIAVVQPLKYLSLMTRRRIIQMLSLSWSLPFVSRAFYALPQLVESPFGLKFLSILTLIIFEFLPTIICVFCFLSMLQILCKHDQTTRLLAKQLSFNQKFSRKKREKSVVIMTGVVVGIFLLCYSLYMRCSFVYLFSDGPKPCNDVHYKIPILVLNSAVNPLAYSFFKRDVKKEIKRRIWCAK